LRIWLSLARLQTTAIKPPMPESAYSRLVLILAVDQHQGVPCCVGRKERRRPEGEHARYVDQAGPAAGALDHPRQEARREIHHRNGVGF
jgi:hypothetical protein